MYQVFQAKMAKPCAVFWDIQNINKPKDETFEHIIELIRSTVIIPYELKEIFFFLVCDVSELPVDDGHTLKKRNVNIVQAYNGVKNSADNVIKDLMRKFCAVAGKNCTILLLSGDGDFCGTLADLKTEYNVSVHLIILAKSFSDELEQISDYVYILKSGVLKPIKVTGNQMFFISITNYPTDQLSIDVVMDKLNNESTGSFKNSASLFGNSICIGFPILWYAENAQKKLHKTSFYKRELNAELLCDSSLTEILKCIKPVQSKSNSEVKKLTFIRLNKSREPDASKIIKLSISFKEQPGIQCILSRHEYLWIVFSFVSDANAFLPKIQNVYPDAKISDPMMDLTSKYQKDSYIVESCEQKVPKEASSQVDNAVKPKSAKNVQASSQNQSSSNINHPNIGPSSDIKPKASTEPVDLEKTTNAEPRNALSLNESCKKIVTNEETKNIPTLNVRDVNNLKMFFRCDYNSVSHMLAHQPTKWSLLYNLFEKIYDLGAKKVIFDGKFYCAHFESSSDYRDASKRIIDNNDLKLLLIEHESVTETHKQEVEMEIKRYETGMPWCLTEELDLHCYVVTGSTVVINEETVKKYKLILGNRECIFIKCIKKTKGEIWIGFPDENLCQNSEKTVKEFLASLGLQNDMLIAKPPKKLLESINLQDLAGDAYDLAFLSSQLEVSKPIKRPNFIKIIIMQRMQEQECNESVFHFTVSGLRWTSHKLAIEQIVKIFVNFSKVIPLAATASYDEVNLIYNSWNEARAASHFLVKLTTAEVPYLQEFKEISPIRELRLEYSKYSEYYIINDKRKVLERIVIQNKSQLDQLQSDSEPSTFLSTTDIDVSDEEMIKKLQYIFTITTNFGFKFTSGMNSIIKMNLRQMDCPVYIEFEEKIWVAVDDLEKGKQAKAKIEKIKFKMLHENDKDDFEVGVVILELELESIQKSQPKVAEMLASKLESNLDPEESIRDVPPRYLGRDISPLGHFNYSYRKAVGMSTSRYCQLNV